MTEGRLIDKFRNAKSRLILLDYDGTLVDYTPMPDQAIPSNAMLKVLNKLINNPKNNVIIISGRKYQDIDKFLGHLPITFIAEHGAMSKEKGKWKIQIADDGSWKNKVIPLLNQITLTCPNSFVEEKHFSITWHYRNAETNTGHTHSRELIRLLENVAQSYNLKIIDGYKVVEIVVAETNKGGAIKYLIEPDGYDCILCMGDDRTDEDMFEYLLKNKNAVTIKVGKGGTAAKYNVESVEKVIQLLEQLAV